MFRLQLPSTMGVSRSVQHISGAIVGQSGPGSQDTAVAAMRTPLAAAVPSATASSQQSTAEASAQQLLLQQQAGGELAMLGDSVGSASTRCAGMESGLGGSRPGDICLGASFLSAIAPSPYGSMLDDEQVVVCANILLYAGLSCSAVSGVWVTDLQDIRVKMLDAAEGSTQAREIHEWLHRSSSAVVYVVTCVDERGRVQSTGGGHWTCMVIETLPSRSQVQIYEPYGEEFVNVVDRSQGSMAQTAVEVAEWLWKVKYAAEPKSATLVSAVKVHARDLQQPGSVDCGLHVALFVMKDAANRNPSSVELPGHLRNLRTCATSARELRAWLLEYAEGFDRKTCGGPLEKERARKALETLCTSVDNVRRTNDKCAYYCTDRCSDRCAVQ